MSDEIMTIIGQIDKRTETYSIRIPEITKAKADKLTPAWKGRLNDALLLTMAKILHESEFDPNLYLKSE